MDNIFAGVASAADIALAPLVRTDYGQQESWLLVLYQLYSAVDATINLSSTFVSRLLIPQRQPSDYTLLSTLCATSNSDLGIIELNVAALPALLLELRLNVFIWTPLNLEWCLPDGLNTLTTQFHFHSTRPW